ncbi:MAG: hypothetical protein JRH13_10365 [Deltaproteobacteria bacterium]|nr:hypothetical protein [Deltaproteobacteria bacterium]
MRKIFVVMLAAAFVAACALPAMAADTEVSFYGNVRMNTFWNDKDKNTANRLSAPVTGAPNALYDDNDVDWSLDNSGSRFGVRFKTGDIGGNVEIRANNGSYYRQWYGTWNFGAGTLLIGHTWSLLFKPIDGANYLAGCDYGDMPGRAFRVPQIRLTFPFEVGTFSIAFNQPSTSHSTGFGDTDTSVPNIEMNFGGKIGPVSFNVFGGYNWLDAVNTANDREYSLNSYAYGANFSIPFGPAYFKGLYYHCKNPTEYGLGITSSFDANYNAATDSIEDVDVDGYFAVLGFKFNDMVSAEIGYGYLSQEREDFSNPGDDEDDRACYYLMVPITVAKGVTITPEIGKYDEKDHKLAGATAVDDGDVVYYGAYWRIDF